MRSRSVLVVGSLLAALLLTGCATAAHRAADGVASTPSDSAVSSQPDPTQSAYDVAQEQAKRWLDAAVLPPHAIRTDAHVADFSSYTAWPCGPAVELQGFWKVPRATVSGTANWLRDHAPANLITTAHSPVPDDPTYDVATIGFIPHADAQEGIVYTIQRMGDGVAVRAEVAALTASATCPPLPDGGTHGAPGQG